MNDLSKPVSEVANPADVVVKLNAPQIFSFERSADYDALRDAYFAELAPQTPYEKSLAVNLVRYEWDIARLQYFRDTAVFAEFRELALNALMTRDPKGHIERSNRPTYADRLLVGHLVSPDQEVRREAEEVFVKRCPWSPEDLFGLAYVRASGMSTLEARIADLERRRRTLRADYDALKAVRARGAVEDAEVVEAGA